MIMEGVTTMPKLKKTTKRCRRLRDAAYADVTNEATIKKMIPYK